MQDTKVLESDRHGNNGDTGAIRRRHVLQLIGSLGVVGGVVAGTACQQVNLGKQSASDTSTEVVGHTLPDPQFALLTRLTELIIPETDTPGAKQTGVADFVDSSLATMSSAELAVIAGSTDTFFDSALALFGDGMRWLDERAFAAHGMSVLELNESQQMTLLESLYAQVESADSLARSAQFLRVLKSMTVEAYYTTQVGLITELGYKGNLPHEMAPFSCKAKLSSA